MANSKKNAAKQVISYRYGDKRKNNPPVGMVDTVSNGLEGRTTWTYDPCIASTFSLNPARAEVENSKESKTGLDESLLVRFEVAQSLPFESGNDKHLVGKIADDRGIENLKVMDITD